MQIFVRFFIKKVYWNSGIPESRGGNATLRMGYDRIEHLAGGAARSARPEWHSGQ